MQLLPPSPYQGWLLSGSWLVVCFFKLSKCLDAVPQKSLLNRLWGPEWVLTVGGKSLGDHFLLEKYACVADFLRSSMCVWELRGLFILLINDDCDNRETDRGQWENVYRWRSMPSPNSFSLRGRLPECAHIPSCFRAGPLLSASQWCQSWL